MEFLVQEFCMLSKAKRDTAAYVLLPLRPSISEIFAKIVNVWKKNLNVATLIFVFYVEFV